MAVKYTFKKKNLLTTNIVFDKDITIDDDCLEILLTKENNVPVLSHIQLKQEHVMLPTAIIDEVHGELEKIENLLREQLSILNEQLDLKDYPLDSIETFLIYHLKKYHANKLSFLELVVQEKLENYFVKKTQQRFLSKVYKVPKNIRPVNKESDEFVFSFQGYVKWDNIRKDFFVSEKQCEYGVDDKAFIYLEFTFDHPLMAINYQKEYQEKYGKM